RSRPVWPPESSPGRAAACGRNLQPPAAAPCPPAEPDPRRPGPHVPATERRISARPAPAGIAGVGPRHLRSRGRRPPAPCSFPGGQLGNQKTGCKGDAQGDQRLVVQVAVGMIAELGRLALALGQLRLGIMLPVHSCCLGGMTEMLLGFHQLAVGGSHGFLARFDLFPAIIALVCYGSVLVNSTHVQGSLIASNWPDARAPT